MRNRRDWIQHRGDAMRKCGRPQRRLSGQASIQLPTPRASQAPVIVGRELHKQIMWMLSIVNRISFAVLAAGEKVDVSTTGYGPRLEAHHGP